MLTTSSLFSSLLSSFSTPGLPHTETGVFFSPMSPLAPALSSSRVETVSGWRKQANAEKDAGLSDSRNTILLPEFACDLCTIGVGRDHYERQLYLYPVHPGAKECIGDSRVTMTCHKFLHICGGCAERRQLHRTHPELLMIQEDYFLTNVLFCPEGEPVRALDLLSELDMLRAKKARAEHVKHFTREATTRLLPNMSTPTPKHKPARRETRKQSAHTHTTQVQEQEERRQIAL